MKKFVIIVSLIALYQNWGSIGDFFAGTPDYQPSDDGVVLYATQWCGYCEKTRQLFAEHGISFVEFDIEESQQGYDEYRKIGGRGVPVVVANGTIIHGYAPEQILAALR